MSSSSSNSWLKASVVDVNELSTDQVISSDSETSISDEVFLANDHQFDTNDEADPLIIPPPPPPIQQVPAATTTGVMILAAAAAAASPMSSMSGGAASVGNESPLAWPLAESPVTAAAVSGDAATIPPATTASTVAWPIGVGESALMVAYGEMAVNYAPTMPTATATTSPMSAAVTKGTWTISTVNGRSYAVVVPPPATMPAWSFLMYMLTILPVADAGGESVLPIPAANVFEWSLGPPPPSAAYGRGYTMDSSSYAAGTWLSSVCLYVCLSSSRIHRLFC